MKPTANLQNTTIGKLLVLHRAESTVDGKSQWLCRCECGREEVFRSDYLLRAKPNNCMCSKCKDARYDLVGRVIGSMEVLSLSTVKYSGHGYAYVCRCIHCGTVRNIHVTTLRNGVGYCPECDGYANYFETTGDTTKCLLQRCSSSKFFVFDTKFLGVVSEHHWYLSSDKSKHVYTKINGERIPLVTFLLKETGSYDEECKVVYLDRDTLNCKLSNIKQVPPIVYSHSKKLSKSNTSGHKGINWNKKLCKWVARITVNYKTIHLGTFSKLEDAVKVREDAEVYFGIS